MSTAMTGIEKRVRALEDLIKAVLEYLEQARHKLGQVSEDSARQNQADGGVGRVFIRGQAVGAISASSGNTMGTGAFRFLQVIGGKRYKLQPLADGDVTAPCVNDTGGSIADKAYLILVVADGLFTVIVADCAAGTPAVAPDPPTS